MLFRSTYHYSISLITYRIVRCDDRISDDRIDVVVIISDDRIISDDEIVICDDRISDDRIDVAYLLYVMIE